MQMCIALFIPVKNLIVVVIKMTDKRSKVCIAVYGKRISELWDVTCHMGSHSVTCHPTQVNAPRLNASQ